MSLITEDELHEIQRIWRMERGDWKNSVYQIFEKVMEQKLELPQEDLTGFGKIEQETLEEICTKNNVSNIPCIKTTKMLNMSHKE